MDRIAQPEHIALAQRMREDLGVWREGRDLVEIGAYKPGTNPRLDGALSRVTALDAFARQAVDDHTDMAETVDLLRMIYGGAPVA